LRKPPPNPLTANTATIAQTGASTARIRNLGAPATRNATKNTTRRRIRCATAAATRLPPTAASPITALFTPIMAGPCPDSLPHTGSSTEVNAASSRLVTPIITISAVSSRSPRRNRYP
jgi:hypothetical protein